MTLTTIATPTDRSTDSTGLAHKPTALFCVGCGNNLVGYAGRRIGLFAGEYCARCTGESAVCSETCPQCYADVTWTAGRSAAGAFDGFASVHCQVVDGGCGWSDVRFDEGLLR